MVYSQTHAITYVWVLVVAVLIDLFFREPSNRFHPVAWIGLYFKYLGKIVQRKNSFLAFTLGSFFWIGGAVITFFTVLELEKLIFLLPVIPRVFLLAIILKPAFSWNMLKSEVENLGLALSKSLANGRSYLSRMVSRNVSELTQEEVLESGIESLFENLNDSLVAPIFFFVIGGAPLAWLYRYANTADAMWGYRGPWEHAGKFTAHADDLLSWIPARITAALLSPRFFIKNFMQIKIEARKTSSPNSGWPMGMAALLLGIKLGKPGFYSLNPKGRSVTLKSIPVAIDLATRTVWLVFIISILSIIVMVIK